MNILVGVHVCSDYSDGLNAAKISLDDAEIKNIFRMSKLGAGLKVSAYDYTPELGHTDIELIGAQYQKMSDAEIASYISVYDVRNECVELHVDAKDFWWEGILKHTDIHWETQMIPLTFLPESLSVSGSKEKLVDNLCLDRTRYILSKISEGINSGLNAEEISDSFQRHVTRVELIRVIWELMDKKETAVKGTDPIYEGLLTICAHRVSFLYRLPGAITPDMMALMKDEAEERAKSQIIEGYVCGELNYEEDNFQAGGWWQIEKN